MTKKLFPLPRGETMRSRHLLQHISPFLLFGVLLGSIAPANAQTFPTFSVDPASPAIKDNLTPDDILETGPKVFIEGRDLGLEDDFFNGYFDNLNALSYGRDPIWNPLYFSVDRVAIGLPGTDVNSQAQPDGEAAGDVYITLPPFGSNKRVIDEQDLGLKPGFIDPNGNGTDGDDLDALDLDTPLNPEFVFFSVDFLSFPHLDNRNDILVSKRDGNFRIYAEGVADIGIDEKDDLDALILWDVTVKEDGTVIPIPNGVLDPGYDMALFSLNTFSPSTFTFSGNEYIAGKKGNLSPADILFTDFQTEFEVMPGQKQKFTLWASALDIGLFPDDDVDALDTVIPEPSSSIALIALGTLGTGSALKRNLKQKFAEKQTDKTA
jgi:hypothetical protein